MSVQSVLFDFRYSQVSKYRKIPKISPGLIFFKGPF